MSETEISPRPTGCNARGARSSRLFQPLLITSYKRCVRRSKSIRLSTYLTSNLAEASQIFLEDYSMLEDTAEAPQGDQAYQLQRCRQLIPNDSRLFRAPYFYMKIFPVGLLKDVAYLYNLSNPTSLTLHHLELIRSEQVKY